MAELGDISKLIEGSEGPANIDWLNVDEAEYRETDVLPKQNLDIVPDLQAAWSHQDAPAHGNLEPNTGEPHTMLDVGLAGPKAATIEEIEGVAKKALDASSNVPAMVKFLASAFDSPSLQAAQTTLRTLVASFRQHQKQAMAKPEGAFSGHNQRPAKKKAASTEQVQQGLNILQQTSEQQSKTVQEKLAAVKAQPILTMLRREMLKGRSASDLVKAMKMSFDPRDIVATQQHWKPLFQQVGMYGAIYSTQDSFADCREGADFLNKHASSVRGVVAGEKCGSCIFSQVGRCMMYGRKLVAKKGDLITAEMVQAVLDEHKLAGRLPPQYDFQPTPDMTLASALKAIHQAAMEPKPTTASTNLRANVERAFMGSSVQHRGNSLTIREVVKTARRYMNEGLYGRDLLAALKGRFETRDLRAAVTELKLAISDQGLQGYKFIDPTVYDDYGKGCKEAARLYRTKAAVQYLKMGSKCVSCVHQAQPGHCSIIHKQLVTEPPYVDKAAEQQAILASGSAMDVPLSSLVHTGLSMGQEFQLQQSGNIDLHPEAPSVDVDVEFGSSEVKL